jgi:protein-S-isoprenylcysteine O-methyltransferase Ste14
LLDTICCHLVAGRVRDQADCLSGKQTATITLYDTDTARRILTGERHRLSDPLNHRVIPRLDALAWIGAMLCIAGLAFCIWARFTLGRNWSGVVTFKGGHELITRGPYRIVRHPIYTGLIFMFVGTVIVLGHVAAIIAVPFVFLSFWIKLRSEEKLMLEKFPDEYGAYQRRVRRIIPFVL